HFNSIAYGARDKSQLIDGIDYFLDGSVVIPPGEVDSKRLLSGNEIKKALKRRKKEAEMSKHKGASVAAAENGNVGGQKGPKGTHDPGDGAKRERQYRFFNGMIDDLSNRFPQYWSDIRDAANFQCLTSIVFMFFASFAPAITFGGLMGKYTNETIGTIETLFAQCICGILWGLFAAQPLLIMSATGPVLIFEASLYAFCENLHLDFLSVRLYAGIWILFIALLIVAVDGSRLLVYVTRFTEDIFATLISAIFIAESLHFVYHTFQENPVEDYKYYQDIHINCLRNSTNNALYGELAAKNAIQIVQRTFSSLSTAAFSTVATTTAESAQVESVNGANSSDVIARAVRQAVGGQRMGNMSTSPQRRSCSDAEPNTALLTAIIMFATFILAYLLKKLRESFYLGRHLRRAIGDFGVLISIAVVALTAHICIPDPFLQRLDMPDHINFTNPEKRGHGLIVEPHLDTRNWWGIFIALAAALLVFILLFVETEITELLLMRKERGCKKGSGMHWDLVLVGICACLCSVFGLPWMCAAAVQSLAHCSSLSVMQKKAPGERPTVDHVIEQRITTIGVSLLIGLIAFAGSYLRLPLASLFGVFLYLGVMNLAGVQFIQRIILFLIPEKYFPVTAYTEQVGIWRMHAYTWIQLVCLGLVYLVKHFKRTALAFPFVLMIFIVFRQLGLTRIFSNKELKALDGEEEEDDDEWMDKDFYENAPIPV
ncbi:anion exchange protein 2, partial [Aphelenchoides avenae]